MSRKLSYGVLLLVAGATLFGQEKTGTAEKKVPEASKLELPALVQQQQALPKIELPEFIITGIAQLNVPDVQKLGIEEFSSLADLSASSAHVGTRERPTVEFENRQKEFLSPRTSDIVTGHVVASLGNYFSPRLRLWLGTWMPEYDYHVGGEYHRTKGYAANTDRSGGTLGVAGAVALTAGALAGGRLGGDASWGTEQYRFFGSTTPTLRRTHSYALFGAAMTSPSSDALIWNANLDYRYDTVDDDGIGTQQHRASASVGGEYALRELAIRGSVHYRNATLAGQSSESISLFQANLGTTRYWWSTLFVQGSAHLYVAKGMSDQRLTRLYPQVSLGFLIDTRHLISLSLTGQVEFVDLPTAISSHPYLDAASAFRHTDRARQSLLAVESDWTPSLRTKLSVLYEDVYDYPLYGDPLKTGIGRFIYTGKTTLLHFRAEGFAKFTSNDYVGAQVRLLSSENSVTGLAVPYLPAFEMVGSYTHAFPFGVSVSTQAVYRHRRETDLAMSQKLSGFFLLDISAEYQPVSWLRVFLNIHNMTDKNYEVWKGYPAPPLLVTGGASVRW